MVTWNPGEILSARPTASAPECGAPMTKTGWVTLRALTMRIWRGGINRVIEAGLRGEWVRGEKEGGGAVWRGQNVRVSPVPYSVRRPHKLCSCEYYRVS